MGLPISRRLVSHCRRLILAFAAILLVAAPNVTMAANASLLASDRAAAADAIMLMDDTPDVGPVVDAPPAMVGAVNMVFIGVVPDEALRLAARRAAGRPLWATALSAALIAFAAAIPVRPPQR